MRSSLLCLAATALLPVAGCNQPEGEDGDAVQAVGAQPLRMRLEHLLGNGPAGVRQTVEPQTLEVLRGIQIRANNNLVYGIRLRYRHFTTGVERLSAWLGGGDASMERPEFILNAGEKLVRVDVRSGDNIDQIQFIFNTNRVYGPFGGPGGSPSKYETFFEGSERREIQGFSVGNAGPNFPAINWIKAIDYLPSQTTGSVTETETHVGWGGNGGSSFLFQPAGDEILTGVQVRSSNLIEALRVQYRSPSTGIARWTTWAGNGSGGTDRGVFLLADNEYFVRVDGRSGDKVDALHFVTSKNRHYGTFGGAGGGSWEFQTRIHGGLTRRIVGFSGMSGQLLDRIEVRDAYPACGRLACVAGAAMNASCDPCVTDICRVDPFCCNNSWDSICVGEVRSVCLLTCETP